jgi:hypothetical protein
MAKAYANIQPGFDTFAAWLTKTNNILYDMATVVVTTVSNTTGSVTSGNAFVDGILSGTTGAFNTIRGGNVATNATLTIESNVTVGNSYTIVLGNTAINTSISATTISTGNSIVNTTINASTISTGNSIVNTSISATAISTGNSTVNTTVNDTTISTGNSTVNSVINSTTFSGTANNASYLGGSSLSTVQAQITGNAATAYTNAASYADTKAATAYANAAANAAALYQTTAGLSANVATLTANMATYHGNSSGTIGNIVAWITGNSATAYSNAVANAAALYQTTAGLSANVTTLTANAATYLGNSSGTIGNITLYITGNAATAYTNATSYADTKAATAYSNATSYADTKAATAYSNAVANAAALYQTTAGLSANVLTLSANMATYLGNSSGTIGNITLYITGNAATAYTNATTYSSNASNLSAGTIAVARLASGGVANSTTILYGNGYWGTIAASGGTVSTFNGRIGDVVLTSADITGNLGYTPVSANTTGTINGSLTLTSGDITLRDVISSRNISVGNSTVNAVVNSTALGLSNSTQTTTLTITTYSGTANNSTNLGGAAASVYVNTSAAFSISGVHTHSANIAMANNYVTSPALKAYSEFLSTNAASTGATALDLSLSNFFNLTLTGNVTFTFSNAPSGRVFAFTLVATQDATGGRTITWPAGTKWSGGSIPPATTTADAVDIWNVLTYDGGTTYRASLSVKDSK